MGKIAKLQVSHPKYKKGRSLPFCYENRPLTRGRGSNAPEVTGLLPDFFETL